LEKQELVKKLTLILGEERVLIDELMSNHTSFKIGGPADVMVLPNDNTQIG